MTDARSAIVFDFDGVIANSEPLHFRGIPRRARRRAASRSPSATTTSAISATTMSARSRRSRRDHGASAGARGAIDDLVARKAVRLEALERDAVGAVSRRRRRDPRAPPPRCRSRLRPARAATKSAASSIARASLDYFTAIVAAGGHAGQQAGARSVSARVDTAARAPAARRSPRATASRSRIRAGGWSRLAPPVCAPLPSPTYLMPRWPMPRPGHLIARGHGFGCRGSPLFGKLIPQAHNPTRWIQASFSPFRGFRLYSLSSRPRYLSDRDSGRFESTFDSGLFFAHVF